MLSDPHLVMLDAVDTKYGVVKVYESRKDGSRSYYEDTRFHSWAAPNGHSLLAYVHAMYGALKLAGASRVLLLGCAGGSLATMMTKPRSDVTVVDINPYAFDLARRYFCLPRSVRCIVEDARDYLEHTDEQFDAIALDAFNKDGIPAHLSTVDFFRTAASKLNPDGVIIVNTIVANDIDRLADDVAASLREATGLPVSLLDEPGVRDRNVILFAGRFPSLTFPLGTEPPGIQEELRQMTLRLIRGGRPLYDFL